MSKEPKPFKRPPKRFIPSGMEILYEDHDLLVIDKACGLLSVGNAKEKDRTAFNLLSHYVKRGNSKSRARVHVVHRLDRDTSGVLVFAKSFEAQEYLKKNWRSFTKTYFAVVHGEMRSSEGMMISHLAENAAMKMYSVNDPELGKESKTGYRVVEENARHTLLELTLHTGRKNQIRVQLADHGNPIVGDGKYGSPERERRKSRLALFAWRMELTHPFTKSPMTFAAEMPEFFTNIMRSK